MGEVHLAGLYKRIEVPTIPAAESLGEQGFLFRLLLLGELPKVGLCLLLLLLLLLPGIVGQCWLCSGLGRLPFHLGLRGRCACVRACVRRVVSCRVVS